MATKGKEEGKGGRGGHKKAEVTMTAAEEGGGGGLMGQRGKRGSKMLHKRATASFYTISLAWWCVPSGFWGMGEGELREDKSSLFLPAPLFFLYWPSSLFALRSGYSWNTGRNL